MTAALDLDEFARQAATFFRSQSDLAAVYLFGSFARGEARADSDLDLGLVFRRRGETSHDRYWLIADLASRLEALCHPHAIDIVVLEPQGPIFCHGVLLEGRRIYTADRDRVVDFESETVVRALDFRPTYDLAVAGYLGGYRRWLRSYRDRLGHREAPRDPAHQPRTAG